MAYTCTHCNRQINYKNFEHMEIKLPHEFKNLKISLKPLKKLKELNLQKVKVNLATEIDLMSVPYTDYVLKGAVDYYKIIKDNIINEYKNNFKDFQKYDGYLNIEYKKWKYN